MNARNTLSTIDVVKYMTSEVTTTVPSLLASLSFDSDLRSINQITVNNLATVSGTELLLQQNERILN